MWPKLGIGAIVGVLLSLWLPPGFLLWVPIGLIGGFCAYLLLSDETMYDPKTQANKAKTKQQEQA